MKLVAGATGLLGSTIVRELRARGDEVRALVRHGSDHGPVRHAGAELAIGDLRERATLDQACRGVDTVISTASATGRSDDTPENVDGRGTENLIDAASAAGVGHFILVSALGSALESPVPVFHAKAIAEAHLKSSGMDYTILQPTAFMDVWFGMLIEMPIATGRPVTLVGESLRRHSFIAVADVAAFVVAATRSPAARNATLVIGGPEPITFRDAVRAFESALGREIPVRSVAPGEEIPGVPEPVWGIAAALESYDTPVAMEGLARSYGVSLTSAQSFAGSRPRA